MNIPDNIKESINYLNAIYYQSSLENHIVHSANYFIGQKVLWVNFKQKTVYKAQIGHFDGQLTLIPPIMDIPYDFYNIPYKQKINIPLHDKPIQQSQLVLNLEYQNILIERWGIIKDISYVDFDLYNLQNIGFILQYFTIGIIYGGLPSTIYGFFLGYLNVPSYIYASATVVTSLPWSCKFFFGILNDTCPILGYKRKPYMLIGWCFCFIFLIILACYPLPNPYYCLDLNGNFNKTKLPCHPQSSEKGGMFVILMMLVSLGYVVADVAADGLMVEIAKAEPIKKRGRIQSTIYFYRTLGMMLSILFVGLCMNGKQYNGSFNWSLEFNEICGYLSIPVGIIIPITYFNIKEKPSRSSITFKLYIQQSFDLLKNKAFFYIVLFQFFSPMLAGISTTASGLVKQEWAGVKNLQNQLASFISFGIFAGGIQLVKKYFLNNSWRWMLAVTTILLVFTDSICVFLTIYDIVRNQYFYLGETILDEIPSCFNFIVSTFIIVEIADTSNAGLVYGLLTTISNLASPFSRAIANALFRLFPKDLSDSKNYIEDNKDFRNNVAFSFFISYTISIFGLSLLRLIPNQKIQAQMRKKDWGSNKWYAWITCLGLVFAFGYACTINFLTLFPSTSCLKIAGGKGC